jgi:acyl carrier protein
LQRAASRACSAITGTASATEEFSRRRPKGKPVSSGIESRITALVATTMRVDQTIVHRDTSFGGDLAADSLSCVELILEIENEFAVDIYDEDAAEILTVGQMIEYVAFAVAAKAPPVASSVGRQAVDVR